ncbi:MAG: lamin tail domain-containing protein, partial [Bacteroidales bacterium]|nr:lamin tail domain-containing protein [Bacteroidales bacterium]
RLRLSVPLQYGTVYELKVDSSLCDCVGNRVGKNNSAFFGRAENIDSFDIVINELLTHPYSGGSDFVEIYNRSDKILDLKDLRISTLKSNGSVDSGKRVAPEGYQLFPGKYCCLSADLAAISAYYQGVQENNAWEMTSFPAYSNSSGRVLLLSKGAVIDDFSYDESLHYPMLRSLEGVSLEKVHPDLRTQDASHWHSASASAGFATPGQPNSCFEECENTSEEELWVESTLFSPDGDGYQDLLKIHYSMPEADCRGSLWVFNAQGVRLRQLLNNVLLERDGMVAWDGLMENRLPAPPGYYLLLLEYWTLSGKVKRLKKVVTIAIR